MKRAAIIYLMLILLISGCEVSSLKGNDAKSSEPVKFSSGRNMVLGNILVAELGKTIYKKEEKERISSLKIRKDVVVNSNENDIQMIQEDKQDLNQMFKNLINK